ncbi:MAG: hypothetical protein KAX18_15145, partial [Candidatus Lokiarchaeota archaeon]|nr:hypothetical protein [Candidatus Lokiarchaeota archaeon]
SRWHTFKELDDWLSDLREFAGKKIPFILIGNKADLLEDIGGEYDQDSAEELAKGENSEYVSTSAKTGENVEGAFLNLTQKMLKNIKD